jgi:hypothetical protein
MPAPFRFAGLGTTDNVKSRLKEIRDKSRESGNPILVIGSVKDGHIEIRDGSVTVYRALRKGGAGQPWIVGGRDSDNFKWKNKEEAELGSQAQDGNGA